LRTENARELFALWVLEARAISVPFALHYIENKV
jgi:hypothetical protein